MSQLKERVDILVVDDRPDGLIALEAVLASEELNIVTALSGAEALEYLPQYDFAAILLDVQMPGMDGFETAIRIKQQDAYRSIPILFVTAINQEEKYIFQGYESGAVDYIFKPFDPYILKSKVAVFVDLHRKARLIRDQEVRLLESERRERLRHLAELELEALRRYQNLADAIPHIVFRSNAEGTIEYFNQVWTTVTGLSPEESLAANGWQSAVHPEDIQQLLRVWLDAMMHGERFQSECRIRSVRDSEYRWHLILGVPERRGHSEVVAWIGTATDIHDRKRAEAELRKAKEVADNANSAKTQFLANMSHEIRTPLSAILGFSEFMMNPEQSVEDRVQGATTIRRNGEQLLHVINEILDISKVEAGKLEIEMIRTDLETHFLELRSLFDLRAAEKGLKFSIVAENTIPRCIETDPTRLRQILVNMVGNAIKFTERGEVAVSLRHDFDENEQGRLTIRVRDTGLGIPESRRDRLFQPFTQVDSSTSRRFGGTGLGLALSKKLANALGGDIVIVDSKEGTGSLFEITIKCNCDLSETLGPGAIFKARLSVDAGKPTDAPRLEGARILLVEDAVDNQVLISRYLKIAGAQVDLAGNGGEALRKTESGVDYDVILMDIQMPEMDGYTATKFLRSGGYTRPIIALTAHALHSEREKCLAAGFDDHLAKPVDRKSLIERIATCRESLVH